MEKNKHADLGDLLQSSGRPATGAGTVPVACMGCVEPIFQSTGTAMLIVDQSRNILAANSTFEKLFSYKSLELTGTPVTRIVPPADFQEALGRFYRHRLQPEYVPAELESKCLDGLGQSLDVILTLSVLPDGNTAVSMIDITKRKRAERTIRQRAETQTVLLKISQDFARANVESIDERILAALKQICEYDHDDRCYVFLLSADGKTMSNTHEWCRDGIACLRGSLQDIPVDLVPWWMEKLQKLEYIYIPAVSALSNEAQADKKILQDRNIRSLLVVPITYDSSLVGFLGFDAIGSEKTWPRDSIFLLNMVSDIFALALRRKHDIMALKESENNYRAIFETTGAATYVVEEDMTISRANQEWERSFGYKKEELEGKKWPFLFPEADRRRIQKYYSIRRIDPDSAPARYTAHIYNKAGQIRDCFITVDRIPGTNRSVATHSDITEFNRITRALKATSAINSVTLQAENETALLESACRKIVEIGGYRFVWVGYVSGEGESQVITPVAKAGYEDGYLDIIGNAFLVNGPDSGVAAYAIRTGQIFTCRSVATDPRFVRWRGEALKRSYRAVLAVPLKINGRANTGAIAMYSDREGIFDKKEVALLAEMSGDLGFAISFLRARAARDKAAEELQFSFQKMHRLLLDTVEALTASLESRDPYTAGHQKRVAQLSTAIAKEMGLPPAEIEGISIAASIHDFGKIVIPAEILSKPGKISDLELALIKTHSQAGYDIVKNIEFPWPVGQMILQHHERLDGSGYPQHLKEDEILLGARIIAVSDVVEAVSSHRPYRPALGVDKALKIIFEGRGTEFDPAVVDACIRCFQQEGFTESWEAHAAH